MECSRPSLLFLSNSCTTCLSLRRKNDPGLHSERYRWSFRSKHPALLFHCLRRTYNRKALVDAKVYEDASLHISRRSRAVEDHFEKMVTSFSAQLAQQLCERKGDEISFSSAGEKLEETSSNVSREFRRVSRRAKKKLKEREPLEDVAKEDTSLDCALCNEEALVVFPLTPSLSNSTIYSFRTGETQVTEHSYPTALRSLKKEEKKDLSKQWAYIKPLLSYLSAEDLESVELALRVSSDWVHNLAGSEANHLITKALEMTTILASYCVDKDSLVVTFLSVLEGKVKYQTLARLCLLFDGSVLNMLREYIFMGNMAPLILDMPEGSSSWVKSHLWASITDSRAVLLRLVERLWTLRHLYRWPLYLQQSTALETLQVFVPLANAAGLGSRMYELGDLSLRVLFPQSYLKLEKWYLCIRDQAQDVLSSAQRELLLCLMRDPFLVRLAEQFTITGRTKNVVSTFMKMLKQNKTKEEILDFIAMRVIIRLRPGVRVEHVKDTELEVCSRVYEIVTSQWKELEGRYKDYVVTPKPNGYRSIHTTVQHPSGFPVEIQIRTEEMHLLAEYGTASHRFYKGEIECKKHQNPILGELSMICS